MRDLEPYYPLLFLGAITTAVGAVLWLLAHGATKRRGYRPDDDPGIHG